MKTRPLTCPGQGLGICIISLTLSRKTCTLSGFKWISNLFRFDGTKGAAIDGNILTVVYIDGLLGDSDLQENAVIFDPGAPVLYVKSNELLEHLLSIRTLSSEQLELSDVNADGRIDIADLILMINREN